MLLLAYMLCGIDFYSGKPLFVDSQGKISLFVRVMS